MSEVDSQSTQNDWSSSRCSSKVSVELERRLSIRQEKVAEAARKLEEPARVIEELTRELEELDRKLEELDRKFVKFDEIYSLFHARESISVPVGPEKTRPAVLRRIAELQARVEPEIQCKLGGVRSSCLADTGSGANYMSSKYAHRQGFAIDRSRSGRVRLANGHEMKTLGTVDLPLSFKNEKKVFQTQFHILLKCSRDVILGSPFLRMTETLTRFAHRIKNRFCSGFSHRVRYMGGGEQLLEGHLNGIAVGALPDTGSDVMLLSEKFALEQGLSIDSSEQHRISLEFGDESVGRAVGVVRDMKWRYTDGPAESFTSDFYVLTGFECDVLLSYDFLVRTGAMQLPFFELAGEPNDEYFKLSVIKVLQEHSNIQSFKDWMRRRTKATQQLPQVSGMPLPTPEPLDIGSWHEKRQHLLRRKEAFELEAKRKEMSDQDAAVVQFKASWQTEWDALMALRPAAATPRP